MSEDILSPCPFCGGEPHVTTEHEGRDFIAHVVYCACGAVMDNDYMGDKYVIEAWNKRVETPSVEVIKKQEQFNIYVHLQQVAENAKADGESQDFLDGILWVRALLKPSDGL